MIREQTVKEFDKSITVLTRSNGIVHAYVSNAKNIKNSKSTATGLLTYSQFVFYKNRERYVADEAAAKEVFIGLRSDIKKLALAQYLCELAGAVVQEEEPSEEQLRLVLNSLYVLSKNIKPEPLVKAAFELRMMSLCGFMPNLVCCSGCAIYEHEEMRFIPTDGVLMCPDCAASSKKSGVLTGLGATAAMRHCVYSEFDKLFSFTVSDNAMNAFKKAAEQYVLSCLDRQFTTLEFYKSIS